MLLARTSPPPVSRSNLVLFFVFAMGGRVLRVRIRNPAFPVSVNDKRIVEVELKSYNIIIPCQSKEIYK